MKTVASAIRFDYLYIAAFAVRSGYMNTSISIKSPIRCWCSVPTYLDVCDRDSMPSIVVRMGAQGKAMSFVVDGLEYLDTFASNLEAEADD